MAFEFDATTAQPVGGTGFDASTATPVTTRGPISEIGNQLKAGAIVDLPKMAGQALQYTSDAGRPIYELGKRIAAAADERGQRADLQPDEANHNLITNTLAAGARMLPQSVVPAAAVGLSAAALPISGAGAVGLAALGGSLPAALSQGQETLDKGRAAGLNEADALQAARTNALIEGAGETVGTLAGAKLLGIAGKPISTYANRLMGRAAGTPAGQALEDATSRSVLKPWAKQLPETALTEVGTEMAQNAGEAYVEQQAGIDHKTPLDAAMEAVQPTIGMTALLAPFGLAGHAVQAKARAKRADTFSSGKADPADRMQAAADIQSEIAAVDPVAAANFREHANAAVATNANLPLGEHLFTPPPEVGPITKALQLLLPAPVVRVDTEGRARMDGVPTGTPDETQANVVGRAPVDIAPGPITRMLAPPTIEVDAGGNARAPGQMRPAPEPGPRETGAIGLGRNSDILPAPPGPISQLAQRGTAGAVDVVARNAPSASPQVATAPQSRPSDSQNAEIVPHSLAPIDLAAHAGATSPLNTRTEPTQPQKEAGNYKLGHVRIASMGLSIENAAGSTRSGTSADGKPWSTTMTAHYGYQKGTTAADSTTTKKQGRDVFVKVGTPADWNGTVFVVDQVDPKTGKFDEHKSIIGADSEAEARQLYQDHYDRGWKGLGAITPLDVPAFKKWSYDATTASKPLANLEKTDAAASTEATATAPAAPPALPASSSAAPALPAAPAAAPGPAGKGADANTALTPKPLSLGMTPANTVPVTVRDGIVHIGDEQAVNFDSGEPIRVPEGATDAQVKQAMKDAGAISRRQRFYGGQVEGEPNAQAPTVPQQDQQQVAQPEQPQDTAEGPVGIDGVAIAQGGQPFKNKLNAGQHKAQHMPQGRVVKSGDGYAVRPATDREIDARATSGKRLLRAGRGAQWDKNPLLAWLGDHGIFHAKGDRRSHKPDLSPDKNPMTSGGPLFRSTGLQLDILAPMAAQAGFLPPGSDDASALHDLVAKAVRGERVAPLYAEGQVENEVARRIEVAALDDLRDNELDVLDDVDWDASSNTTLEAAMRSLGFTEQEISDAIAEESRSAQANREGGGGRDETASEPAPPGYRSAEAAPGATQGLSAPTKDDILAQQQRAEEADKAEKENQRSADQRAQADAQRADFTLTGSDRPADVAAAKGQQTLFEPTPNGGYAAPYETDLFGNAVPRQQALPDAGAAGPGRAEPKRPEIRGDAQPAGAVSDTEAPAGDYYVNTFVAGERRQRIGAAMVRTPAEAAQATGYLYKSPVERFDAIVTDKDGKPLAIVGGFKGAVTQTSVFPATVLAEAVRIQGAARVWFSHNHPSGSERLSEPDQALNRRLSDAFRGSGIDPMGLLAVAADRFEFVDAQGDKQRGVFDAPKALTQVPILERELHDDRQLPLKITTTDHAKAMARDFYRRAGEPGIVMLDAQAALSAWVPLPMSARGALRGTGGLNAIYRAVSQANATSALIVHGGELNSKLGTYLPAYENVARALNRIDVHVLDVIDAKKSESLAATGALPSRLNDDNAPMFRRDSTAAVRTGISRAEFSREMAKAFGVSAAQRLERAGVVIPLEDQRKLPEHIVSFVRDGQTVFGLYDPVNDRTYAVLSNLTADMVRGLALHEIGVHYGFEAMLGRGRYAKVMDRIAQLGKAGNVEVLGALDQARRESASPEQVREETLAYLVHQHPEVAWVKQVIAQVKAFLFQHFGIGASNLTIDDIAALARASVLHASRADPNARRPDFARAAFSRDSSIELDAGLLERPIADLVAHARLVATQRFAGETVRNASDGSEIMIPGSGIKHALFGKVSPMAAAAATRLDEVISRAQFVRAEPDKKGRNTIKEVRFYDARVRAGEQEATITVVVRVAADGSRYYDHFEMKEKAPAGQSGKPVGPGSLQPFAGAVPTEADAPIVSPPVPSGAEPKFARASAIADLTPGQEAALGRVGGIPVKETVAERLQGLRANMGTRIRAGLVDQFAPLKGLSQHAYMLARLSTGGDGTMEAAMLYGKPFLRGDVPDVDVKDGGFAAVLATLKGEHDRFLWWVAAQRAERLKAEGRENLFSDTDIAELRTLDQGDFADGTQRAAVYSAALERLTAFNESTLKMALDSGLITQQAFDVMKDQPYVPFYRVMDEEGGLRFSAKGGLVNQSAYKQLKGGAEKLNNDLLQNMLLNWSHLYTASARNRAARAAMQDAMNMAIAYPVPAGTKGAVAVKEAGLDVHYAVEDAYVMEALSALHYVPSELLKPLQAMKHVLTLGVTANPAFKIRNLIRDSLAAMAQSDLSYNPLKNIAQGWKGTAKESQVFASMLAAGGVMRFGSTEDTKRVRRQIEGLGGQLLDKNGWQKLSGQVARTWEAYQELGDRGENVNRVALYEQLVAKGHSHEEASFMARDLLDFSMSGQWGAVRFLAQTVPFFNARLQGLYKLGRAAAEDPRRFGIMSGAVIMASLGLYAAYGDDDDWKKREDWDRDASWWFKIGDTAFRIPKPFEVGAIGTLVERTAEYAFEKEMTGARYRERLSNMLFQTFAFDPTPQIVKPIVDVYANKDSFTGRAIEGTADAHLKPEDRFGERTSEAAKLLGALGLPDPAQLAKGNYGELSPKQIDFMLRGYFGWMATAALTVSDYSIRPLTDRGARPAMQLRDVFLAGNFVETLPTGSSRYVTQLYDQSKVIEQAYGSYQAALKRGDTEAAQELLEKDGPKIRAFRQVEAVKRAEGVVNAQARRVEASKTMDADSKRGALADLERRRDALARQVPVVQ